MFSSLTKMELFVSIPIVIALYILTKHFLHKFQNLPPTPFLNLPLIGHLHLVKRPLHRTLANISNTYGPVTLLRFGSRCIILVSSASAAEQCFTKNDIILANRPRLLAGKHIGHNYTTMEWSSYGDHWRNLRKVSAIEILSVHSLQSMHDIRHEEVKSMILGLKDGLVNMKTVLFEVTMNIMTRMIAGKRYYGENIKDSERSKRFREIAVQTMRMNRTSLGDFMPVVRWFGVGGMEKRLAELQVRREEFMQELVEECKARDCKSKTMIGMLIKLQGKEPDYYTDELIRSLMLTLLVGGSDTTAGTMEWALSLLVNNPHFLNKAQQEIDSHVGKDRLINEKDITCMPYLHCIINETLRMYPAGPLIPHESSEECIVGNYHVPARTMVLVNAWAIHNDPENWVDPTKFNPQRFDGIEGTRCGFKFMPFSSGRRGCPGEGLAVRVLGLVLGSLIQCFDWERVTDDPVDMTEGSGLTMPRVKPLMVYCKTRHQLLSQL